MPLLDALLRHARDRPHDPAALDTTRSLDWAGLRAEVEASAGGLAALGVGPGDRVGLHLPNSVDFLVVVLATWWRGATFIPLDFSSPPARIATLIADCEPALVVSAADDPVAAGLGRVRAIDPAAIAQRSNRPPPPVTLRPDAYLIYTSGTAGTPKGVRISQAALDAFLSGMGEVLSIPPSAKAMIVSPFHFDGSFATLFGVLEAGGLVTIPSRDGVMFPRNFVRWVERYAVDTTGFSPTYLRLLLRGQAHNALSTGSLRKVALGGEALIAADVLRLLSAVPRLEVYNRYGPTEATIAVAHHRLRPEDLVPGQPVPLGSPHQGTTFHVLDEDLRPVPEGQPGELWIGGSQLMDGYWKAPELTAERMRTDVIPDAALYRTGDLVRAANGKVLVWLDRLDNVVSRRGLRTSLAEVANALSTVDGVEAALAISRKQGPDAQIIAFVIGRGLNPAELQKEIIHVLPEPMLPDRIVPVEELPLTTSGKVDQSALMRAVRD